MTGRWQSCDGRSKAGAFLCSRHREHNGLPFVTTSDSEDPS